MPATSEIQPLLPDEKDLKSRPDFRHTRPARAGKLLKHALAYPQKVFLVVSLFFGCLFLIIIPPGQISDEYIHFYRSYQISDGQLVAQTPPAPFKYLGGYLPRSFQELHDATSPLSFHPERKITPERISGLSNIRLNPQDKIFYEFPNAAYYAPLLYLPQTTGLLLGKLFSSSLLVLWYMGRLGNLLAYIGCVYFAIKFFPVFQWVILLAAVTPMALNQAASFSIDSLTNGMSLLLIGLTLRYAYAYHKILGRKELGLLFALAALVCLAKQSYFPLVLLYGLIPVARLGSFKRYLACGAALAAVCASLLLAWNLFATLIIAKIEFKTPSPNVSSSEQIWYVMGSPLTFASLVWKDLLASGPQHIQEYIGTLGWMDTRLENWLIIVYCMLLVFMALVDHRQTLIIGWLDKLKLAAILAACYVVTITLLYIYWTPLRSESIEGFQGRYLIPIAPLFLLLFYNQAVSFKISAFRKGLLSGGFAIVALFLALSSVSERYYADTLIPIEEDLRGLQAVGEIVPDRPLTQTFSCPVRRLEDLAILMANYQRLNNGQLAITLREDSNERAHIVYNLAGLKDNSWLFFKLKSPIENCRSRKLTLTLSSPNAGPGNAVTAYLSPPYYEGFFTASGVASSDRNLGLAFNSLKYRQQLTPGTISN